MKSALLDNDPVTFEVVRSGLYGICEEMRSVMMRAAFSPLLSLSADLSCAILDHAGDVVAQGNDIPVHLGAMPFSAKGVLAQFPLTQWAPGDVVLSNDPYSGGSHLPDMTMLTPIFAGGAVCGFAASRVHWPDIGGAAPGSSAVTDEIIKEGLRLPPIKIVRAGVPERDLCAVLFANVRVPEEREGDFQAQIACNARGVERVEALIARYGAETVRDIFAETQTYSERLLTAVLETLPDGVFTAVQHIDGDGFTEDFGDGPFALQVTITKSGAQLEFDFSGSADAARGPMNAPISVTASACYYFVLALAGGAVPPNSGAYRTVKVKAAAGSLLNAVYPSPVVAANTEISSRIVDLLLQAFAPAMDTAAIGGSYGCAGVWTVGGFDPIRARRFVHLETVGGGMGASRQGNGLDGHRVHMGNTMSLPVEAVEAACPVLIDEFTLIENSGGTGKHRGGKGARRVIRALADHLTFSLLFERAHHPAPGVLGGSDGRRAAFSLERAGEPTQTLASKTPVAHFSTGDRLIIETAGGGGWGEPEAPLPSRED